MATGPLVLFGLCGSFKFSHTYTCTSRFPGALEKQLLCVSEQWQSLRAGHGFCSLPSPHRSLSVLYPDNVTDLYTCLDSEDVGYRFLSWNYWHLGFKELRATRSSLEGRKKSPSQKSPVGPCQATWRKENSLRDAQRSRFIFHSTSDAARGDGLEKLVSFGWGEKKTRMQKKKPVFDKTWRHDAIVLGTRGVELLIASFPGTGCWFAPSHALGCVCQRKYQPPITL